MMIELRCVLITVSQSRLCDNQRGRSPSTSLYSATVRTLPASINNSDASRNNRILGFGVTPSDAGCGMANGYLATQAAAAVAAAAYY